MGEGMEPRPAPGAIVADLLLQITRDGKFKS
jgi:hypothetical protein